MRQCVWREEKERRSIMSDPYQVLGVPRGATEEEIKKHTGR